MIECHSNTPEIDLGKDTETSAHCGTFKLSVRTTILQFYTTTPYSITIPFPFPLFRCSFSSFYERLYMPLAHTISFFEPIVPLFVLLITDWEIVSQKVPVNAIWSNQFFIWRNKNLFTSKSWSDIIHISAFLFTNANYI